MPRKPLKEVELDGVIYPVFRTRFNEPYANLPCDVCGKVRSVVIRKDKMPNKCTSCAAKDPIRRQKVSEGLTGFVRTDENKEQIRQTLLAKHFHLTDETKAKMSAGLSGKEPWNKGKELTEEDKLHKSIAQNHNNHHTDEMNKAIGEKQIGKIIPDELRQQWSISHTGKTHTDEEKLKESLSQKELYKNPEYKNWRMKKARLGAHARPTRPERIMLAVLEEVCPNQYEYTGDGRAMFCELCPDFTNIDGQKKIIEVFGNYWHSEAISGKSKGQEEKDRKEVFRQFGFETLVIWEHELENDLLNDTMKKVKEFNEKKIEEQTEAKQEVI